MIQGVIHKLEVAGGMRYLRVGLIALAVIGATAFYNFRGFRNMASQEAMDSAQLARNIASGKGYSTYFIRPFSMFLVGRENQKRMPVGTHLDELSKISDRHPDIANAPVYPLALAGLMKVLPFRYAIPEDINGWIKVGRYQPDVLISVFNQILFFTLIVVVFFLARRLFDRPTAWLSAALLFGADVMWRFSMSGISTMLLLLIFAGVAWCLTLIEETVREGNRGLLSLIVLALLLGVCCGLGALTRYSFAWLIIPVMIFLLLLSPRVFLLPGAQQLGREIGISSRPVLLSITLITFLLLTIPWIIRNIHLSGAPFGTASYFLYDGTASFPENRLEQALQPEFPSFNTLWLKVVTQKFLNNLRHIVQNDLLRLGGGLIGTFFFVSLIIPLGNPGASRLRRFLVGSLFMLIFAQALGRTHLSDSSPDINMENLLVLMAPLVIIFGVQFFWLLLGQISLPFRELRYVVIALFCLITCLPLLLTFLPPKPSPLVYPPYFPPYIQRAASFVKQDELAMSDIPWALAWYGNVPSVLLTEGSDQFVDIDGLHKSIAEIYLTSATLDSRFLTQWMSTTDGWGYLLLNAWQVGLREGVLGWPREVNFTVNRINGPPSTLSLHYLQGGWPQQCLLTRRKTALTPVSK